jgi:pimeloyl-ACP methyl ester carboxylesterase
MATHMTHAFFRHLQVALWIFIASIAASWSPAQAATTSGPALKWSPCPPSALGLPSAGQQCANLEVPLDYDHPHGKKINIAISRIAARPGLRHGVLLLNPGGPGNPGIDLPRQAALLLPQSVLDRFDLIGFDPRFVGASSPISCGLDAQQLLHVYPYPAAGGFSATASMMKARADACSRAFGNFFPFATTAYTARDIDEIRKALQETTISYIGYSYGTYLGAVYATLFPNRTDRIVLDSSVAPDWVWRKQMRSLGPANEIRFSDFANFVTMNDATYHLGTSPEAIRKLYFTLSSRLNDTPLTDDNGLSYDGNTFREATRVGLEADRNFPALAQMWQILSGPQPAMALPFLEGFLAPATVGGDTPRDNAASVATALQCGDVDWPRSLNQYHSDVAFDSSRFPLYGAMAASVTPCAFWSFQQTEALVTPNDQGPNNILMVHSLRDSFTPYAGGLDMHARLGKRSRLLSVDLGDHGVFLLAQNQCVDDIVTRFLIGGVLPKNDQSCGSAPALDASRSAVPQSDEVVKTLRRYLFHAH